VKVGPERTEEAAQGIRIEIIKKKAATAHRMNL
jgi:hypothetical protein